MSRRSESAVRHPLVELTIARFLEFLREPEALFWVFAFPVILTFALGIAFRAQDPTPIPVGVVAGPGASALIDVLRSAKGLTIRELSAANAEVELRNGRVQILIEPTAPPTYRFDPTRPESRLARLAVDDAVQRAYGRQDRWTPRDVRVTAPGSRYVDWVLPGLLGMNIMGTGMWSIGFAIVQARTRKLLKRFMATPMRRTDYLLSQVFARLAFLALEVVSIVGFGMLAFGVPLHGSVAALAFVCVLGAFAFGGLGLLIASRPRTIEGVSGLMNFAMLPMWVLSGVFFSSENFPAIAQPFIRALPLTALNEALRGVMLEGAPLGSLWLQVLNLGLWGVACLALAIRLFRWR